jgi:hypothetical protein
MDYICGCEISQFLFSNFTRSVDNFGKLVDNPNAR